MPKILLAGQDLRLLTTRAAVLRKTGAEVMCCSVYDALRRLDCENQDLVVLCHSLPEDQAAMIADKAHQHNGKTRVLRMVSDSSLEIRGRDGKFDATSLPDPGRLITRATELLDDNACFCQ